MDEFDFKYLQKVFLLVRELGLTEYAVLIGYLMEREGVEGFKGMLWVVMEYSVMVCAYLESFARLKDEAWRTNDEYFGDGRDDLVGK